MKMLDQKTQLNFQLKVGMLLLLTDIKQEVQATRGICTFYNVFNQIKWVLS